MSSVRTKLLLSFVDTAKTLDQEELALVVSDMCVDDNVPLSASEATIAYDILCRLYPDVEGHIRRKLAELFALRDDVPHSLILLLANDKIEIARSVIMHSPLLGDEDLIKVIVERTREHRLAVSVRQQISAKVTDVLVYLGDEDAMVNLARNDGAAFSEHALKRMVTASRTAPPLQEPLLKRPEMRADLAAMMYQWVGQSLRHFIAQNYGEALSMLLDQEVSQATEQSFHEHHTHGFAPAPSTTAASAGQKTAKHAPGSPILNVLLVALRRADMQGVEDELKSAARLSDPAIQRVLYNDNGEALAVVCRALGVSRSVFSEFFTRLHGTQPYGPFTSTPEHVAAIAAFERLSAKQAGFILGHWQSHPETVWGDPERTNAAWEIRQRSVVQ
jgi:uncharacterized protein (DUF2336 family)